MCHKFRAYGTYGTNILQKLFATEGAPYPLLHIVSHR